eukprot:TRINITY_DN771_c0_g2_i2.p1 TRINITY_DN771_c0_g2~~TRINITY_DN771_c0_g2_i2.p1  ORF type:complete len:367 (-),score=126.60 TRINITY_DN771_c0_g2_i2:8-1108(-)
MIPKFLISTGQLVKLLLHTGVTRYLEFKAIDGSYVYRGKQVYKVPSNDSEALSSKLMGWFEKRRAQKFFVFLQNVDEDDESTWNDMNLNKVPMAEVFKTYGLEDDTIDFIGHAMALHTTDDFLSEPAMDTIKKIRLYVNSMGRYGKGSPYIYTLYGLGEIPQAFARLAAIYGGTYMLDRPIDEIVYDEDGKACGVTSAGETVKCGAVIGDPSYFPDKVDKTGQVVRCICILNHSVPGTDDSPSLQLIVPQKQTGRHHDIYISVTSSVQNVCNEGYYLALVSTTVETDDPESELEAGFALLGDIQYKFMTVADTYAPKGDGKDDNCFISTSYDASTHFETTCDDILDMYERLAGQPLEIVIPEAEEE